jgi:uncharacterized NAD(P)/FAD-binding protein YdhS
MRKIFVIGAGFSGTLIAARLLMQAANQPIRVYLLNGSGRIARGMAYGTQSARHVLNVPAGNMSAFDDDPDHFLRFAQSIDPTIKGGTFVSRRVYGDYLEWILNEAEKKASVGVELLRVYQKVESIHLSKSDNSWMIRLEGGEHLEGEKVILALGHFSSSRPKISNMKFYENRRYLHDPWDSSRIDAIPARASVLLLGTGLTAVDAAMTLMDRNPNRRITALSRRGLLPQGHRQTANTPLESRLKSIWGDCATVRTQLRAFRKYCDVLHMQGRDWREGLAVLRHETAGIWQSYSYFERKRFSRHVQPFWDTHRHRLAPDIAERFYSAQKSGVIQTLAGRLSKLEENGDTVEATLCRRGRDEKHVIQAQYVINCTGPCSDPRQADSALVQRLLIDGLIRPDALGLGIDVAADCSVVTANGRPLKSLFYIGPWLKSTYWEATAVPDLRVIAAKLTERVLFDTV